MPFFHLRSPAGTVWPPLPTAAVSQVWAAYRELDRTQWLSPAELEELQFQQLRVLLRHCFEQVPYYRRVMTESGVTPETIGSLADLRRLPLLSRESCQANLDDLKARGLPPGMKEAWQTSTSGTNGVPIKVHKTNHDDLWWSAFYLRDLEWCGLDPRGRLAAIRLVSRSKNDSPRALAGESFPYWSRLCELLMQTGPAHVMEIRQDPRRQLEWLRGIEPNYLVSLPTNLEFLAGLLLEEGRPLKELRAIQAISEPLPPDVRTRIETGFGAPVKNVYSATECGYIASPCPAGHGLHVHGENVLTEVLDSSDQPCLPGQTGRVVLTGLHSFLMPFVRYDILDDVTLGQGPCPCGRGLPLVTHVEGRRHLLLHLPDGRRKSSIGITRGIRWVGGAHQLQYVQRAPDHIIIRVVPDRTWHEDNAARMRQVVHDEFGSPIRVDVETMQLLSRTAGGKVKIFVNELDESRRPG